MSVGDDIATSLRAMDRAVRTAVRDINRDAAKVSREELEARARLAAGPDRKFSRFKGPRLGVKSRQDRTGVTVSPTGPWKIAEEGADPHGRHPGTRATQGKRRWSEGRDAALVRLDRTIPERLDHAGMEGFRG